MASESSEREELEKALREWVTSFPAGAVEGRLAQLELENDELRGRIAENEKESERLQGLEEMRNRIAPQKAYNMSFMRDDLVEWMAKTRGPKPSSKREAVRRVLYETDGPVHLHALRDDLITRGWIEDAENDRHAIDVTLSTMRKAGEVERPRAKHYSLSDRARHDEAARRMAGT